MKFWRKQKGMTQFELARVAGIKFRHYQEIESGRVDIKIRTFGAVAQALKITPEKLLTPHQETKKNLCKSCVSIYWK